MIDAKIFLNTKIENSGLLSAIGNIGLAPVRYLFKGHTIQEVTEQKLVTAWPFKADNCSVKMLKTVASIVLLIPGLLLSLFKAAAYLYSDVKDKHALVKKHMTQTNQSPSHERVAGAVNRIVGDPSLNTQITIEVWNPKEKQEDATQVFKHLDIGSSNYGPESSRAEDYRHTSSDVSSLKMHRVLFCNMDHVIESHSSHKEFIFYLNDISSSGLDKAALNLADHLRQKNKDKNLKIKIVKIVEDIFKLNPFPSVDSATFIHPSGILFGRIMMRDRITNTNPEQVTDLFLKATSASKTGLLVKESNMSGGMTDAVQEVISNGFKYKGLKFELASTGFIPPYTFPSGETQDGISVSYLVTQTA